MPDERTLVALVAQRHQVTVLHYATTRTRVDLESDVRAWFASWSVPMESVATALFGKEGKGSVRGNPSAQLDDGDVASTRERRASQPYGWLRKAQNTQYNVHNLDARDADTYKGAVRRLAGAMGGNNSAPAKV
tara:strand:+ start:7531 stop:7929 length:399 start_codon:yes stop_codon:yes gene_type:complete